MKGIFQIIQNVNLNFLNLYSNYKLDSNNYSNNTINKTKDNLAKSQQTILLNSFEDNSFLPGKYIKNWLYNHPNSTNSFNYEKNK